jgi:hypothetical protein
MPSPLEDILRKHEKKDLYTDWLEKNPLDSKYHDKIENLYKNYLPDYMGPHMTKKRIFKDTAHGYPVGADLDGKLRARLAEKLRGASYGGFTIGQLVGCHTGGVGVIVGFHRHHDFPYATDGSPYISKKEEVEDDGATVRADVLVGGVVHRVPLPNLFVDVERVV